jgi:hypothetical protein
VTRGEAGPSDNPLIERSNRCAFTVSALRPGDQWTMAGCPPNRRPPRSRESLRYGCVGRCPGDRRRGRRAAPRGDQPHPGRRRL